MDYRLDSISPNRIIKGRRGKRNLNFLKHQTELKRDRTAEDEKSSNNIKLSDKFICKQNFLI